MSKNYKNLVEFKKYLNDKKLLNIDAVNYGEKMNDQNLFNLANNVFRYSIETPDAIAIHHRGLTLSYRQLAVRISRIALRLQQSLSDGEIAEKGVRVGILASRSIDACVAMLAACWVGATYVPLGIKFPEERLEQMLPMCGLSALIVDDEGLNLLTKKVRAAAPALILKCGVNHNENMSFSESGIVSELDLATPEVFEPLSVDAKNIAYIIFTSGTTGVPKGVMISAGAVHHYVSMITDYLGLVSSDRVLETCEINFDFSIHNMFSTWAVGASLYILPASEAINAIRFAKAESLTVWNSVPSLAGILNQVKALKPRSLDQLRITVFGGEQLPRGIVNSWKEAAPNSAIFNLYGPTEATVFCMATCVGESLNMLTNRDVISIGRALPGNEAIIIDAKGQAVADGEVGELAIAGRQLADGYLGASQLTDARFPNYSNKRWYLTGDNAIRDSDGNFYCLGRIDNQVKVSGYRVELEEIDSRLREITDANLVGTVAWPIENGSARGLVSFIVAENIDEAKVISRLKRQLPQYMVPTRIVLLDKLPTNNSGKVDRASLKKLLDDQKL